MRVKRHDSCWDPNKRNNVRPNGEVLGTLGIFSIATFRGYSMKRILASAVLTLALGTAATAEAGQTLDNIKSKGVMTCGVNDKTAGFGAADSTGKYTGIDIDVCRAVATAI